MSDLPKAKHFFVSGVTVVRDVMVRAFKHAEALSPYNPVECIVRPVKSRRSIAQNAKLWATLADISEQLEWPVNGIMQKLSSEDWKTLITAAARNETRVAAGLSGGAVMLGASTRKMTVVEMGDVIEFMHSFGAERGVAWSEKALQDLPTEWESA